ncbi:hypothetical protein SAVIM40S_07761 [Streptomyces avidinii]
MRCAVGRGRVTVPQGPSYPPPPQSPPPALALLWASSRIPPRGRPVVELLSRFRCSPSSYVPCSIHDEGRRPGGRCRVGGTGPDRDRGRAAVRGRRDRGPGVRDSPAGAGQRCRDGPRARLGGAGVRSLAPPGPSARAIPEGGMLVNAGPHRIRRAAQDGRYRSRGDGATGAATFPRRSLRLPRQDAPAQPGRGAQGGTDRGRGGSSPTGRLRRPHGHRRGDDLCEGAGGRPRPVGLSRRRRPDRHAVESYPAASWARAPRSPRRRHGALAGAPRTGRAASPPHRRRTGKMALAGLAAGTADRERFCARGHRPLPHRPRRVRCRHARHPAAGRTARRRSIG